MNVLLFLVEIFLIVAGIALVPARSELRISRARVIHNEPDFKVADGAEAPWRRGFGSPQFSSPARE